MDKDRAEQFIGLLKAKGINPLCSACGKTNMGITGFSTLPEVDPQDDSSGTGAVPVVVLACTHWGHLQLHSDVFLGQPPSV